MWIVYLMALLASSLIAQTAWTLFDGFERKLIVGLNAAIAIVWAGLFIYEVWGARAVI